MINAQPQQQFFVDDFSSQSDWEIENIGLGIYGVIWENSEVGRCNFLGGSLCLFVPGQGLVSRVISTADYHTLKMYIDNRAHGNEDSEYCYLEYLSASSTWTTVDLLTGTTNQLDIEISIPDTDNYNNQQSFAVRLGHKGDAGGDGCFFDNLKIFGIPYTNSPTTDPTPAPTDIPSALTDAPTGASIPAPTDVPVTPPTEVPTGAPIPAPTDVPVTSPTKVPTSAPSVVTPVLTDTSTSTPTEVPIRAPTVAPTTDPTCIPTVSTLFPAETTTYQSISTSKPSINSFVQSSSKLNMYHIMIIVLGSLICIVILIILLLLYLRRPIVIKAQPTPVSNDGANGIDRNNIHQMHRIDSVSASMNARNLDFVHNKGPMTNVNCQVIDDEDAVATRKHTTDLIEVKSWLETHVKLSIYYDIFINNGYETLEIIKEISDEQELESIGILSNEHRIQILKEIEKLNIHLEGNTTAGNMADEGLNIKDDEFIVRGDDDDLFTTTKC